MPSRFPWSRRRGQHAGSLFAVPGKAATERDSGPAGGDLDLRPPAGPRQWPVSPTRARVAEARATLASFTDRFPDGIPGCPDDPVVDQLLGLVVDLWDAAATLDAALRHHEQDTQE